MSLHLQSAHLRFPDSIQQLCHLYTHNKLWEFHDYNLHSLPYTRLWFYICLSHYHIFLCTHRRLKTRKHFASFSFYFFIIKKTSNQLLGTYHTVNERNLILLLASKSISAILLASKISLESALLVNDSKITEKKNLTNF